MLCNGLQIVESGGTASSTAVNAGEQDVFGSAVSASVLDTQVVEAGGVASATTLNGGLDLISSGGMARTVSGVNHT